MINSFDGKYRFLSNFYNSPIRLNWALAYGDMLIRVNVFKDDICVLGTVEHGYQALKASGFDDVMRVLRQSSPAEAKRAGRRIRLRPDWEEVKLNVMESLLRQKFNIPEMKACLLATKDQHLVEGNTWGDRYWGVCQGQGENHLGKLLMKIREELKNSIVR